MLSLPGSEVSSYEGSKLNQNLLETLSNILEGQGVERGDLTGGQCGVPERPRDSGYQKF